MIAFGKVGSYQMIAFGKHTTVVGSFPRPQSVENKSVLLAHLCPAYSAGGAAAAATPLGGCREKKKPLLVG